MNRDVFVEDKLPDAIDRRVAGLDKADILALPIPKSSRKLEFDSVGSLVEHLIEGKAMEDLMQEWEETKTERTVMDRL